MYVQQHSFPYVCTKVSKGTGKSNNKEIIDNYFLAVAFSILLALFSTVTYNGLCFYVHKHLPNSFTYGEASIVLQGCVLFLVNVFLKLANIVDYEPLTNMGRMSTILQVNL